MENISFDDFVKVQLKTAKILEAEKVEKSNKLIKMQIEVGEEKRQLVAGIGKAYTPEDLVGKTIIVVANLEPKSLMGIESQGMLLAATDEEGLPILLSPEKEVASGIQIK